MHRAQGRAWAATGTRTVGVRGGRRPRAPLGALVPALLSAGLLTGCSADDAPQVPSAPPSADDGARPDPTADATVADARPRGPLDRLLDTVDQRSTANAEEVLARMERYEEVVAACMAEEGFEYTPTDWRANPAALDEAPVGLVSADPVADAAVYGYGISTTALIDEATEPTIVEDPNADRVAAMSGAERRAWDLALNGPGQGEAYREGSEAYDWTRYGCLGRAAHETEVDEPRPGFDDSAWSDLREDISVLEAGVWDDPRLTETHARWAACMAEAGYGGYTDARGPVEDVIERSMAIWDEVGGGAPADPEALEDPADPAAVERQAEVARLQAELAQEEIALAVADSTCQVEVAFERAYTDTWIALQEEFYAAHQGDLDAGLAAFEEFQAGEG